MHLSVTSNHERASPNTFCTQQKTLNKLLVTSFFPRGAVWNLRDGVFFDTLYRSFSTTWKIRVHSFLNVLCVFTSLLPLAASTTSPLPILPKQVVPNARENKTSKGKKNRHPGALRIIKAVSFSFSLNSRAWLSKGSEKIDQPKKAIPEMKRLSSWWFQPIWKILVKMGIFPIIGVKIKHIWNHHPVIMGN